MGRSGVIQVVRHGEHWWTLTRVSPVGKTPTGEAVNAYETVAAVKLDAVQDCYRVWRPWWREDDFEWRTDDRTYLTKEAAIRAVTHPKARS